MLSCAQEECWVGSGSLYHTQLKGKQDGLCIATVCFVPTCQRAGLHESEVRLAAVVLLVCVCPHSCWFQ